MLSQDVPFGKLEATSNEVDLDTALQEVNNEDKPYDPAYDRRDMRRLGRIQEVKRRFRFFSIVGYMVILASTWEYASTSPQSENKMLRFLVFRYSLVTSVFSLSNGGTAGTIWLTLIACCGMFLSCLSMAEMASKEIYPRRPSEQLLTSTLINSRYLAYSRRTVSAATSRVESYHWVSE
ncbi:hypothetical protein LTR15_005511 [Elasticomyces elasticus]|nr:hypothetical protein LTR15_005511 [Elasticomyces elasticus]